MHVCMTSCYFRRGGFPSVRPRPGPHPPDPSVTGAWQRRDLLTTTPGAGRERGGRAGVVRRGHDPADARRRLARARGAHRHRPPHVLRPDRGLSQAGAGRHRYPVAPHVPVERRRRRKTVDVEGVARLQHQPRPRRLHLRIPLPADRHPRLVEDIHAVRPLTIAFSAAYLALSLRFWFYGPAILTGIATACFTVATVLSVHG